MQCHRVYPRSQHVVTALVGLWLACVNAAQSAEANRSSMSFDRKCNRPATNAVFGSPRGEGFETTAPSSSPEFPLQQPARPRGARDRGEWGTVVMEIYVTDAGLVSAVRVAQSSGFHELDVAAMKVTERWRLRPGTLEGEPVCMWARFAVTYSPETDSGDA